MGYTKNEQRLREQIKAVEAERDKIREDLNVLRGWWVRLFRAVLKIHGEGNAVDSDWITKEFARAFTSQKSGWWWS